MKVLFILLAASLFFASCKQDNSKPANHFTYKSSDYNLSSFYMMEVPSQNSAGAYGFELIFLSNGFTVYEGLNDIDSISGSGSVLYVVLASATASFPGEVTYQVDTSYMDNFNNCTAGTVAMGAVDPNLDIDSDDGPRYYIVGGTMDISGSLDNVNIKFNLIDENGDAITGTYKGAVDKKFMMLIGKSSKVVWKYSKKK